MAGCKQLVVTFYYIILYFTMLYYIIEPFLLKIRPLCRWLEGPYTPKTLHLALTVYTSALRQRCISSLDVCSVVCVCVCGWLHGAADG